MNQTACDYDSIEFPGKQNDERVLYVIAPHALPKWLLIFKTLVTAAAVGAALYYLSSGSLNLIPQEYLAACLVLVALSAISFLVWNIKLRRIRTYLTDRRIVRTEHAFPFLRRKRTLFWAEASRAKAISPNFLFRLARVGTIEVASKFSPQESVAMNNVYYFDDLANYIDKILHLSHTSPGEISNVRPFVPRPKGRRD